MLKGLYTKMGLEGRNQVDYCNQVSQHALLLILSLNFKDVSMCNQPKTIWIFIFKSCYSVQLCPRSLKFSTPWTFMSRKCFQLALSLIWLWPKVWYKEKNLQPLKSWRRCLWGRQIFNFFIHSNQFSIFCHRCDKPLMKPLLLYHLIKLKVMTKALIFTKGVENSHSLAILLKQFGLSVGELSSKVIKKELENFLKTSISAWFFQAQEKRVKVLSKFKNGQLDILVCTDALARGIDIGSIDYVVSYDLPMLITSYIHRVGRTARAGKPGVAISIVEKVLNILVFLQKLCIL